MPYWWDEGKPNRPKGFVVGLIGGIAGMAAMQLYWRYAAPRLFPEDTLMQPPDLPAALDEFAITGKQYRTGESAREAISRIVFNGITGVEPSYEKKAMLSAIGIWLYGMFLGGLYGGTR
ncbi:MAG: hypothetical protein H7175_04400, partial [Burkholderiales bacterium]|nr:hypothetical protein [Anaerolineae bacterium]